MNNNRTLKNSFFVKIFFNSKFIPHLLRRDKYKNKSLERSIIPRSKGAGFIFIFALAVLLTLSFPIIKNFSQRNKAAVEIKELEAEIESMNKKNGELRQLVDYLNSDRYLEERARLNFGLKKKGEETAVIEMGWDKGGGDKKSIYNIPGLEKTETPKPPANPQKWLNYFLKQ